jgi:hypothetical protein
VADAVGHGPGRILAGQHLFKGRQDRVPGHPQDAGILPGEGNIAVFADGAAPETIDAAPQVVQAPADVLPHGSWHLPLPHHGHHFPGQLLQAHPVIQAHLGQEFVEPVAKLVVGHKQKKAWW